eukprot:GHRR01018149.1.p2 GENE.GHRR01018149.1~~GHRR01018149.1.p2  ORF type:complete len:124 (+),score=13.03 GHRR01018149.1:222-593(+)
MHGLRWGIHLVQLCWCLPDVCWWVNSGIAAQCNLLHDYSAELQSSMHIQRHWLLLISMTERVVMEKQIAGTVPRLPGGKTHTACYRPLKQLTPVCSPAEANLYIMWLQIKRLQRYILLILIRL